MPEIPEPAIKAAAEAIMSVQNASDDEPERWEARRLASAALEAAWPILADDVAKAILRHSDEHEPKPGSVGYLAWHRHFRIAAHVAAGAFNTRKDHLRMTAEAIKRGDFIACDIPETPREP